jgi:PhzF family phenazine biosynthesis protein
VLDLGYRHVDVFSRRALQGNGLVVVLDTENLSTAVMQQLTREVRPFETAFLTGVDLPGRSARVRIFTEHEKLDFAGHPVWAPRPCCTPCCRLPARKKAGHWRQRSVETRTRGAAGWRMARPAVRPAQLLATCCITAPVPPGSRC